MLSLFWWVAVCLLKLHILKRKMLICNSFCLFFPKEIIKHTHCMFWIYFIWFLDAGKSTTGGQILFLSGQVDDRTIQKYEKEAKDKSRESWWAIGLLHNLDSGNQCCSIYICFPKEHANTGICSFIELVLKVLMYYYNWNQ